MFDINKLPELNPECFTLQNYEVGWWELLDLDFSDSLTVSNVMRCVKKYAVGYCESGALLTYRYVWPEKEIPYALQLVSDYDCWKFEYGNDSVYFHLGMLATDNSAFSGTW